MYFATDRDTGRPRGFAFVTFAEESQAAEAIVKFNGAELDGRALNINEAKDRPANKPRGGPRPNRDESWSKPRGDPRPRRDDGGSREFRSSSGGTRDVEQEIDWDLEQSFNRDDDSGYGDFDDGDVGRYRGKKPKKPKGSRRRLRARKRSL